MQKPCSVTLLLLADSKSVYLRLPRLTHPPVRLFSRVQHLKHRSQPPLTLATSSYRPSNLLVRKSFQTRNMSTPADHRPSRAPPKTPGVPRPSARYAIVHLSPSLNTLTMPQCALDIAHESNPLPAPRFQGLQFCFRTRFPWRCPVQDSRRRDSGCKRPG